MAASRPQHARLLFAIAGLGRCDCRVRAVAYARTHTNNAASAAVFNVVGSPQSHSYVKTVASWTSTSRRLVASTRLLAVDARRSYCSSSTGDDHSPKRYVRLTDLKEIVFPSPVKMLRNAVFAFLIKGYFDPHFHKAPFLEGAIQAIVTVSKILSDGRLEELRGLVAPETITEIQTNMVKMSDSERKYLAVAREDIALRYIYEIGIMYNDSTNQRFVEVTVVAQGMHGYDEFTRQIQAESSPTKVLQTKQDVFFCNYRFIREYTKGVEDSWIINKLNHFRPTGRS